MNNSVTPYKYSNLFWLSVFACAGLGLVMAYGMVRYYFIPSKQKVILDYYGTVPEFQLFNQEGKLVSLEDLKGSIWVASFMFTRCQGPCPIIIAYMAKLSEILKEKSHVKLISITVDPGYDTVSILSKYAKSFHTDSKKWSFLTGSKEQVEELITGGMHQAIIPPNHRLGGPIHSTQLVVVDPFGKIRAFHDGTNAQVITQICNDIRSLEQDAR